MANLNTPLVYVDGAEVEPRKLPDGKHYKAARRAERGVRSTEGSRANKVLTQADQSYESSQKEETQQTQNHCSSSAGTLLHTFLGPAVLKPSEPPGRAFEMYCS
ncbi:hypothetical protein EYF80_034125 [Liparis tanakae]|uniref:Uncharacterized protein n=1 Tax=Liparis tanakae TaxID=230148 RepID=A0A4Z2GR27_9TELE|nr:hypothetical protein EYF80_034125 [Liparis tanakae]